MPLYCRPSDILSTQATLSLPLGSEQAAFPLTNSQDRLAHTVFKAVATTALTIRLTFSTPKTAQALALIHHNLSGASSVTVTNAAGFNNALAIASNSEDGHCIDPWKSYVGLANVSSTVWDIAIQGSPATAWAIGEIVFVETLRTLNVRYEVEEEEKHAAIVQVTDYGVRNKYGMGVRQRSIYGTAFKDSERDDIVSLQRDARGPLKNFLLVLQSSENDAIYVDLDTESRTFTRIFRGFTDVDLRFVEQVKGLAL
jgi:hypothetical protein